MALFWWIAWPLRVTIPVAIIWATSNIAFRERCVILFDEVLVYQIPHIF